MSMENDNVHPDEGTIHAWLDDALTAEESARIEEHVSSCASCAAAVAEARGLIAGASRVVAMLDDGDVAEIALFIAKPDLVFAIHLAVSLLPLTGVSSALPLPALISFVRSFAETFPANTW